MFTALETCRKVSFWRAFLSCFAVNAIAFIFSYKYTNIRILCLSCNVKTVPKQLPNCIKRSETLVVLIIFSGVPCDDSAYAKHESGTRKKNYMYILVSDRISGECNLTAPI